MSTIVGAFSVLLVVVGVGLVGARLTWRGIALGLGIQYAGVVVHLVASSGWVAGIATAVVAVGIEALLLMSHDRRVTPPEANEVGNGARAVPPAVERPSQARIRIEAASRLSARGEARRQWFDLSVIALAVVGAVELALSRPLVGDVTSDAIFNILMLTGLLYCLIGQPVRLAGGLLLIASAGSVLLHAADSAVTSGETLLFAAAQLALVLVLVQWEGVNAPEDQPS